MNLLVTGASGLVGKAVVSRLREDGHRVESLRRTENANEAGPTWNPQRGQVRLDSLPRLDAVIHLAGESIAQRWTQAARERIRASRVDATRLLSEALARLRPVPRVMICASATGFYGDRGEETLSEESGPGSGFLAEVCQAWEAAAAPARQAGLRVVHLRFGIVLAREGGALAKMLPGFRLGLGGRLGRGRQYWGWIALEDVVRVVELAMESDALSGAVNTVAPEDVTNAQFTSALARALHRPAFLGIPAPVVRAAFGQMGREALLASGRVRPDRLAKAGFVWRLPTLKEAFAHLLEERAVEAGTGLASNR